MVLINEKYCAVGYIYSLMLRILSFHFFMNVWKLSNGGFFYAFCVKCL